MPPRIPILQCLRANNGPSPLFAPRAFSSTPSSQASTVAQRRRRRDPYAIAQARARKAANISRQEVLRKERTDALGDPVRGVSTPFLESFDTAEPIESLPASKDVASLGAEPDKQLNFYLSQDELSKGLERSKWLSTPPTTETNQSSANSSSGTQEVDSMWSDILSPRDSQILTPEQRQKKHQEDQSTATEALKRISSLSLGSSKDRLRVNIQRCINVFGRHTTDLTLPSQKPPSSTTLSPSHPGKTPRTGPDTGSSEVQIAILTAKIRTLADFLDLRGGHDKANKRNLRLLVHRRQKLLKYLRKKERGGPRWRNLVETLGLTDGTWKEQISI